MPILPSSKATFRWLKSPADCPKKAIGFDFDGAEFTHVGGRVTFEVLLVSFGLDHDRGSFAKSHQNSGEKNGW